MLKQRATSGNIGNNNGTGESNSVENPNSAMATALSSPSEQDLRVPYYCEENVWRLAYRRLYNTCTATMNSFVNRENEQYYVVFISNEKKCCPMLHQKASSADTNDACFWDYHVILVHSWKAIDNGNKPTNVVITEVFDVDSRLPYPCALDEYLNGTFNFDFVDEKARKQYSPKFRVVRAELFLRNFYSDRMHMFHNGKWSSPPPKYDCILTDIGKSESELRNTTGSMSNLNDYINMTNVRVRGQGEESSSIMGEVLSLLELRSKFKG